MNRVKRDTKASQSNTIFEKYIALILQFGQLMHFSQAWKIFNTKSAGDISMTTYVIYIIFLMHWLIYGIMLKSRVIIISQIIGLVGAIGVIAGILMYG